MKDIIWVPIRFKMIDPILNPEKGLNMDLLERKEYSCYRSYLYKIQHSAIIVIISYLQSILFLQYFNSTKELSKNLDSWIARDKLIFKYRKT